MKTTEEEILKEFRISPTAKNTRIYQVEIENYNMAIDDILQSLTSKEK